MAQQFYFWEGDLSTGFDYLDLWLNEEYGNSDAFGETAGAAAVTRTVAEAVVFAETAGRTVAALRALAETVLTSDKIDQKLVMVRALVEALLAADREDRQALSARLVTETALLVDSAAYQVPRPVRLLSETMLGADRFDRQTLSARLLSDAVLLADALASLETLQRSLADSFLLVEASAGALGAVRSILETAGLSDLVSRAASLQRSLTDALLTSDSELFSTPRVVRVLTETLPLSDSTIVAVAGVVLRQVLDSIGIADAEVVVAQYRRVLQETVPTTDQGAFATALVRQTFDTLGLADVEQATALFRRVLADGLMVVDQTSRSVGLVRQALDALVLSDSAVIGGLSRLIADLLVIFDRIDRVLDAARQDSTSAAGMADAFLISILRGGGVPWLGALAVQVTDYFSPVTAIGTSWFWERTDVRDRYAPVAELSTRFWERTDILDFFTPAVGVAKT